MDIDAGQAFGLGILLGLLLATLAGMFGWAK
jgi:hypothetical protein